MPCPALAELHLYQGTSSGTFPKSLAKAMHSGDQCFFSCFDEEEQMHQQSSCEEALGRLGSRKKQTIRCLAWECSKVPRTKGKTSKRRTLTCKKLPITWSVPSKAVGSSSHCAWHWNISALGVFCSQSGQQNNRKGQQMCPECCCYPPAPASLQDGTLSSMPFITA